MNSPPAARGSQEAGFVQRRAPFLAAIPVDILCFLGYVSLIEIQRICDVRTLSMWSWSSVLGSEPTSYCQLNFRVARTTFCRAGGAPSSVEEDEMRRATNPILHFDCDLERGRGTKKGMLLMTTAPAKSLLASSSTTKSGQLPTELRKKSSS